jgi:hypothetical protein
MKSVAWVHAGVPDLQPKRGLGDDGVEVNGVRPFPLQRSTDERACENRKGEVERERRKGGDERRTYDDIAVDAAVLRPHFDAAKSRAEVRNARDQLQNAVCHAAAVQRANGGLIDIAQGLVV